MYNSRIKHKFGVCPDCSDDKEKTLVAGRCVYHNKVHRHKINAAKKKERISRNGDLTQDLQDSIDMNVWFEQQRPKMTGVCCNCHQASSKMSDKYYKYSIAHIFPKNIFRSVMLHPLCWIELCIRCHTLFDRDYDTASKMSCWWIVKNKARVLLPLIKETHKLLDVIKSKL